MSRSLSYCYYRRYKMRHDLRSLFLSACHNLSSSEVTAALRPFYFLVHPDLFARYPRAQTINDANLKLLNNHLDSLVNDGHSLPVTLQFYVKSCVDEGSLTTKSIVLNYKSPKLAVQNLLQTFKLPTNYVDKLEDRSKIYKEYTEDSSSFHYVYNYNQHGNFGVPKMNDDLYAWLLKNMGEAEKRLASSEPIRRDIIFLKEKLIDELQLQDLSWERGIGTTHLRGCLQGLKALANHYPHTCVVLQGRQVHFGNESGVSLDGSVILSTSEVRDQWFQLLCRVTTLDGSIQRIPFMQKTVSNTLKDIQVTHRKYQPFLLVDSYSQQLRRLVTSLGDYVGSTGFPKDCPASLSHLQLVVESANSPLMLSPTGQFIAPSSCPPWLLINFITENMQEASRRIASYESMKGREKELLLLCREELALSFLDKDDSLSPEVMIHTLSHLIDIAYRLTPLLSGARMWITHYYSVMLDGEVCIPYNWYNVTS